MGIRCLVLESFSQIEMIAFDQRPGSEPQHVPQDHSRNGDRRDREQDQEDDGGASALASAAAIAKPRNASPD